jgi:hypothetical protein
VPTGGIGGTVIIITFTYLILAVCIVRRECSRGWRERMRRGNGIRARPSGVPTFVTKHKQAEGDRLYEL